MYLRKPTSDSVNGRSALSTNSTRSNFGDCSSDDDYNDANADDDDKDVDDEPASSQSNSTDENSTIALQTNPANDQHSV